MLKGFSYKEMAAYNSPQSYDFCTNSIFQKKRGIEIFQSHFRQFRLFSPPSVKHINKAILMLIFLPNLSGFGDKTMMPDFIVVNLLFSRETNTVYLTALLKILLCSFFKGRKQF